MSQNQTTFTLQPNASVFINDLLREINNASHSIAAQFYTFEADATGRPVAEALLAAHKRGVRVRLMVDHYINLSHNDSYIRMPRLNRKLQRTIVAEWQATNKLLASLEATGVGVKLINPLGFMQRKMLRRDHKKLVAIDDAIAYVGGINLSDHNASWNDFMVKMRGDIVPLITKELQATWEQTSRAHTTSFSGGQFITDVRGSAHIIDLACELINGATKRVTIETPYLWGKQLITTLSNAAQRGVEVTAIVPLNNNWGLFVPNKKVVSRLSGAGVHVYRYAQGDGMTHAKVLIADNTVLFGSSNFNEFLAGRINEASIATQDTKLVTALKAFLARDIARSRLAS